ncbi:putative nuclease HARBI1 [Salvelinus alpinus]
MATRAAYFSPSEAQILMEAYEEVKDIIKKKGNTATVIKQREKLWQSIADRLNALNMNGPKRTWQQVKIKYKNILQNAVKKNTHRQGTGGGSPKADLTPAEDMALRFFASGAFLYSVGDAEQLNKATICRTIRSVCLAIKALADVFISFPGHRRLCDIKEEFYRIAGFPNVIGAVDCTHIRIKAPSGAHEADFVNRKSFHSINVQMVCNADCVISNVVAKWPGSVHDSRIFRASEIYQCLSQGEFSGVLLGDRGYGCQPFLLTPFTDPQEAQQAYNHAHARTRARVEMTFGLLKARFHCLHKLRVSPVRACDITVACAVLHNVACLRKERAPRVPPAMDWDNPAIFPDDDSGRLLRDQYVLNYFS